MSNEQLALVAAKRPRKRATKQAAPLAKDLPVARVIVDVSLPHLDRTFDYSVPEKFDEACQPGVRVRVRFAGRLVDGYVADRCEHSEFSGKLTPISAVVSPEVVLPGDVLELCTEVAARGACSLVDVLRAAIPPRHARAEAQEQGAVASPRKLAPDAWGAYFGGDAFIARVDSGVRAVWTQLPQDISAITELLSSVSGGVIVVVPDRRSLDELKAACDTDLGPGSTVTLSADLGPESRYRAFLQILRGESRIVIGTRGAVFAPVQDLRLIVVLDDTDDALVEPHAPYWNARDVAAIRAHQCGCSLLVGGLTRSLESQAWLENDWAKPITPHRSALRDRVPRVQAISEFDLAADAAAQTARIPHRAWTVARDGLRDGPVLVQVARRGYAMGLSCQRCRTKAVCECGGPLASDADHIACTLCQKVVHGWRCSSCSGTKLRAAVIGNERTGEELGRAFPGVRVVMSDASTPVRRVGAAPAIVVSTPGMEPIADGGYSAVLILDAMSALERAGLHASEQAVARWFAAAALAAPSRTVVITADAGLAPVQALIRWDPGWFAAHEYAERVEAGLPPATRVISVTGQLSAVEAVCANVPAAFVRIGPTTRASGESTTVLMGPRSESGGAATALHAALKVASAKSSEDLPTVRMDADLD